MKEKKIKTKQNNKKKELPKCMHKGQALCEVMVSFKQ
jgi:hypothetical protein